MDANAGSGETVVSAVVAPPRPPRPPDFAKLQTLLKREALLISGERTAIKDIYENIQSLVEELLLLSWNTQQLGRKVDLLLNSKLAVDQWLEFESESKEKFSSTYAKFSTRSPVFEKFLSILWDNPIYLAKPLADPRISKDFDIDEVVYALLFSLYGNFFAPREEQAVLRIMEHILQTNYESRESPQSWLRENTLFSRMFTIYAKNYTSGRLYLKAALQEPVMAVLEDDLLNLEIDPVKVYQGLSQRERLAMGLGDVIQISDGSSLADHQGMKQLLGQIYPKIVNFCKFFVKCLTDKLPCMPFGIRWVCRQICRAAIKKQASSAEAFAQMGDLLLLRFITPAIMYPEPYGIITDTPVSHQARRNLTLIAKVLRGLARGAKSFFQRETYMMPLQDKLSEVNLEQYFAVLQNVGDLNDGLPFLEDVDVHSGRKLEVVTTVKHLAIFQSLIRSSETIQQAKHSEDMVRCMDKMKNATLDSNDDDLLVVNISDDQTGFQLLSETEVLANGNTSQPLASGSEAFSLVEVKKQLRAILSSMDLARSWRGGSVIDVLRAEAMEANTLETRNTMAQVGEAIRLLRTLPEQYKINNFFAVFEDMLKDYRARSPYVRYLVKLRQDLLLTQDQLRIQRDRVSRAKHLYHQYHKTVQINNFIEKRENEIVTFVDHFTSTELLDEKAALVTHFLQQSMEALSLDRLWRNAPPNEKIEANALMEKYFMCRIYASAFNPNDILDQQKDSVFTNHINEIIKFITLEHESMQINPRFRSQAPWPLAQKELLKINVYKAPGDKLQCIVDACKTIMNLITLNGAEVGADDFFPVLVYVVIQANPQNLLSTVQYIKYFYETRATGEASYWWSQFLIAVEFIKTLNPKNVKPSK